MLGLIEERIDDCLEGFCCSGIVDQLQYEKHSWTSRDVQFKEFSLTKQKTRHKTDYE